MKRLLYFLAGCGLAYLVQVLVLQADDIVPTGNTCVRIVEDIPELGAGIVAWRPHVTLFVQPATDEGDRLRKFVEGRAKPAMSVWVCGYQK